MDPGPARIPLSRRLAADAALIAIACLWGATFPLAKVILRHVPPFLYLAVRFAFAAAILAPFALRAARGTGPARAGAPPGADVPRKTRAGAARWAARPGFAVGLALAGGYALQTLGLRTAAATVAAFITGLSVVLVSAFGVFLGRRPAALEWVGVVMATAGLALLTLRSAAGFGGGELLVLGCAVCFAWHILFLDRAARETPPLVLGAIQNAVVAVVTAMLVVTEPLPSHVPATIWLAILAMGATASALAFSVQAWAQRFTTPAHVGLIFASEPVAAAVIARMALGEAMTGRQWIGAAFILGGIVVAELARPRVTPRSTPT